MLGMGIAFLTSPDSQQLELQQINGDTDSNSSVTQESFYDFFPIPVLLWRLHMLLSFSEYYSTEAAKAFCQCHFSEEHIMCTGLTG